MKVATKLAVDFLKEPFKDLSNGPYRLVMALWITLPLLAFTFVFLLASIFLDRHSRYQASEFAINSLITIAIMYYPFVRLFLWVAKGFEKDKIPPSLKWGNPSINSIIGDSSIYIPIAILWKKRQFTNLSYLKFHEEKPYITFVLDSMQYEIGFDTISEPFITHNYKEKDSLLKEGILTYSFVKVGVESEGNTLIKGISDYAISVNLNEEVFRTMKAQLLTNYTDEELDHIFRLLNDKVLSAAARQ